jgi:hypothetical protein
MRSFSFATLVITCAVASSAVAQTGSENNLVFTIFGGVVTGHQLWTVEKQPISVLGTTKYDTLRLSRAITSSVALGATATYFLSGHVGLHAEISYMGLPLDSDCSPVFMNPDTGVGGTVDQRRNGQVCDDIRSQAAAGSVITIFTGVTLRAASRRSFSPYVRGNIGIVSLTQSTIDMAGVFTDASGTFERQVIADPKPRRTSPLVGLAAGFSTPLGPGYQFRFELRDQLIQLERLTGPGSAAGPSPTATKFYHHASLVLGLDVVLERKRGRRY